jgi:hypothetical protein
MRKRPQPVLTPFLNMRDLRQHISRPIGIWQYF